MPIYRVHAAACTTVTFFLALCAGPALAYSINDPIQPCVPYDPGHGGGQHASALRAGSLLLSPDVTSVCDTTGILFTIDNQAVNADIDLIYSKRFISTGYPYMDQNRINQFLFSLDINSGENEFHLPLKDFQLGFNTFHARDTTLYYSKFGGNNNMLFNFSNTPTRKLPLSVDS